MQSHASERSRDRMGRKIRQKELTDLRFRILKRKNKLAWFVKEGANNCEKWVVKYENEFWYLVYDPSRKWIVTVLDPPSQALLGHLNIN